MNLLHTTPIKLTFENSQATLEEDKQDLEAQVALLHTAQRELQQQCAGHEAARATQEEDTQALAAQLVAVEARGDAAAALQVGILKRQHAADFTLYMTIDTLQHTASHCNTLQHTITQCNVKNRKKICPIHVHQHTATHCNTLQHAATHCNILKHTALMYHIHDCNANS